MARSTTLNRGAAKQPSQAVGRRFTLQQLALPLCFCVLAGLVIAVYGQMARGLVPFLPGPQFDFILLDDGDYIFANRFVKRGLSMEGLRWAFLSYHSANWHPLTWLSLMLDVQLFGLDGGGFHLVNAGWHLANVLLLFVWLRRITQQFFLSAVVAAFWAVHPLHVESVAWVSERKDVLSTFFALLTLLAFEWYARRGGTWRYLSALAAFGLSMLSKQMWVTLPCLLLLLDYWPMCRTPLNEATATARYAIQTWKRIAWEKAPFFLLTIVMSTVIFVIQRKSGAVSDFENVSLPYRFLNALVSYSIYLYKTIWPTELGVLYPLGSVHFSIWTRVGSGLLLATISVVTVLLRKSQPWLIVGWLWYLGTLVPVIGVVQVGSQAWADRYAYVPHIGLFIMMVWGVAYAVRSLQARLKLQESARRITRYLVVACTAAALLAMTVAAHRQTSYWEDSEHLFTRTIEVTQQNYVIATCLGSSLVARNRLQEAKVYLKMALDIDPNGVQALDLCAMANHHYGGDPEESKRLLERAIKVDPKHAKAKADYAMILIDGNEVDKAMKLLDEALELDPTMVWALTVKAIGFALVGKFDEAHECFEQGIELDPSDITLLNARGDLYSGQGETQQAKACYEHILDISPDDDETHVDYGTILAQLGDIDGALRHFRLAVKGSPQLAEAHYKLAKALGAKGQTGEAIVEFEEAIKLRPSSAEQLNDLAWLLATENAAHYRNGAKAVKYAELACKMTKREDPTMLDTLAAAYAEAGRWDEANKTAEETIALAEKSGQKEMAASVNERATLYKSRQPYRASS